MVVTVNDCVTFGAALYVALPAWLATTRQVPALSRVIVAPFVPLAVQTLPLDVANVTVRPDEAVAETVNGDWLRVRAGKAPNVIVWVA